MIETAEQYNEYRYKSIELYIELLQKVFFTFES